MKKNKKHKFSIIELFCIIVIVGLLILMGILAIIKVLEESKINDKLAQEESIIKASKLYINKNMSKAPIVIGDSINISFKTLKDAGYLTDITNSDKESCMNNSYVRVYKLNPKEYTYLPYLYCGEEKVSEVEELVTPKINLLFIDGKDKNNNNLIFNNIYESRIYVEMDGGIDSFGRDIEIDTYEITISMKTNKDPTLKEYYTSGMLSANRRTTYTLDQKIMNYVNAKDATSIYVVVRVKNILGGVNEVTSIAQSNK